MPCLLPVLAILLVVFWVWQGNAAQRPSIWTPYDGRCSLPVSATESKARPCPLRYDYAHRSDGGVNCVCLRLVEDNVEDLEQLMRRALFENCVKRPIDWRDLDAESLLSQLVSELL